MAAEPKLIMAIRDVFLFTGGRTVFSGVVDKSLMYISPRTCELYIEGVPVAVLRLESEMIPLRNQPGPLRAVSTTDKFDWDVLRRALPHAELRELREGD